MFGGVGLIALAGCGPADSEPEPGTGSGSAPSPIARPVPAAGELLTTRYATTVLDDGDGAELCLGGVAESYPPQCGGPRLVGWDWADHEGAYEEANGVRWGDFLLVGSYDGEEFTVEEVLDEAEWPEPTVPAEPVDFTTPCPEPDGGWQVVDPELTTEETMYAAFEAAAQLDGYAGAWMDQSINPASGQDASADDTAADDVEDTMNDPELTIVNVRVTGDPAVAEEQLREVWGGPLCVSVAEHTEAELQEIQSRLHEEVPGVLSSGVESTANRLFVGVVYDDGSIQAELDEIHGDGVVQVDSALVPVE